MRNGFTLVELMVVLAIIGIMSALFVSVATTTGNPEHGAIDVTSSLRFARQRAIETRRIHRVQIEPTVISVWQSTATGYQAPAGYEQIQVTAMPPGIIAYEANASIDIAGGATPTLNATLNFPIDFRPDGSSSGGTVFVTDINDVRQFRVVTYRATGGAYLREGW